MTWQFVVLVLLYHLFWIAVGYDLAQWLRSKKEARIRKTKGVINE